MATDQSTEAARTTDHETTRQWAEERDGHPATVGDDRRIGTASIGERHGDEVGIRGRRSTAPESAAWGVERPPIPE